MLPDLKVWRKVGVALYGDKKRRERERRSQVNSL